MQKIEFTTLLEYCRKCTNIKPEMIVDIDAGDAKSYQLMLIQSVVDRYEQNNIIRTFIPLLSSELSDAFNESRTNRSALFSMLQHEFSIQIKGRTNCTIDEYYEIPSIENGLPCKNKKDKEFIFELFNVYQDELKNMGSFDLDDVIMESLSHLNAPLWRRQRSELGFDYIFADEMHMFNLNEQSVFHYLTKSWRHGDIAICFALDYSQAIGDRGDITRDYANTAFGNVTNTNYATVFRNSPAITELCTSIAVSGTLMFQDNFKNPYISTQSSFTSIEEAKSSMPVMIMYPNDEAMKGALGRHIESVMKALQCKPCEIAVISFIPGLCGKSGVAELENLSGKHFSPLLNNHISDSQKYVLASPYEINGLEFKAVILLGVDEGRVPQTAGTSDISKQYIHYTAYNLLYLTISRAKYKVVILGNSLNGVSSCLQHSLNKNYLLLENIYNA